MDVNKQILNIARAAQEASHAISFLSTSLKNQVLSGIADALLDKKGFLKKENEKDSFSGSRSGDWTTNTRGQCRDSCSGG